MILSKQAEKTSERLPSGHPETLLTAKQLLAIKVHVVENVVQKWLIAKKRVELTDYSLATKFSQLLLLVIIDPAVVL